MNTRHFAITIAITVLLACVVGRGAKAADLQISGSITQEIGVKITGKRNENNAAGNPFNGVAVPYAGLTSAPTGAGSSSASGSSGQ